MLDLILQALLEHSKVLGITHLLLTKIRQGVLSFTLHLLNSLHDATAGGLVRNLLGLWLSEGQVIILVLLGLCRSLQETLELTLRSHIVPLSVDDVLQSSDHCTNLLLALGCLDETHATLEHSGSTAQHIDVFDQLLLCCIEVSTP